MDILISLVIGILAGVNANLLTDYIRNYHSWRH